MDPVIVVGAGPVGLTLALALARQDVPSVVLDEGPGKDEQRPARTVVLNEDTAALLEVAVETPLLDVRRVAYTFNEVPIERRRWLVRAEEFDYMNITGGDAR